MNPVEFAGPLRVLIVEHDAADAELCVHALRRAGFEVMAEIVETRDEFATLLDRDTFDVVLADFRLPDWTGMDALELLRERSPDTPLILVSGTIGEERAVECLKRGAADYVLKNNITRLPVAVRLAVAERSARAERTRSGHMIRRLMLALDQSPAGVIITDTAGTIEYVNRRFSQITGYSASEVLGRNPRLLQSSNTSRETYRSMWDMIRAGHVWSGEIQNRRKNGELFWNAVSIAPVRDEAGEVTHYVGTQEDITDRRRAEATSREREELFRELGDNIREVFFIASASYDATLYVNPAYETVWGRSCESLYANPFSFLEAVVPEDRKRVMENMADVQRGEDGGEVDFRVMRPDGSVRWVTADAVGVRNEQGEIYRITGILTDVTERKRAQDALAESEARFRTLTEASFDGIDIVEDGIVRDANRGFADMFGYTVREVIGRPVSDFVADESIAVVVDHLERGHEGTYEVTGRRKDGSRILVEVTARNHIIEGKRASITALRDVTEKRQLEEQLRQSQKMEAIGRLAGGIAHDFNNLLTVILGNTDLVLEVVPDAARIREDLNEVRKAAEAAATLTRQLLAFSRQHVIEPKLVVVEEVLANTGKILKRLIGEDINLVMLPAETPSTVRIDPGQLEQIVMNLAVNARDAMPAGGTVTIETSPEELDESYARTHWAVRPGRFVRVAITDTGIGMDDATRERIFDPFFTTKEPGKGTGLGLSTVYGIVKQVGGMINVYSELARGATFRIYLPVATAADVGPEDVTTTGAVPRGTETVLVVEDAAAVRTVVSQALRRQGYTVIDMPNPRAALKVIEDRTQPIDLLLTDVVMPDMGGRELSEAASRVRPGLRIAFMSGYTDDAVVRLGVLEPGMHYIQKPFSPDSLAHMVRRLLDEC